MTSQYFMLQKQKKAIMDEDGEKTGYPESYYFSIPRSFGRIIKNVIIQSPIGIKYVFKAIPIFNKPQFYYILPMKIKNNLSLKDVMNTLEFVFKSKEQLSCFMVYDNVEKDYKITKEEILKQLGYIQTENGYVFGKIQSESGIVKLEPYLNKKKKLFIPKLFKTKIDQIFLNSWNLTVLYTISDFSKDERGRNYKAAIGINQHFKEIVYKLIEMKILFVNNQKIYDVYTIFNFKDESNKGIIYELINFGNSIKYEDLVGILKKYNVDIETRKEEFNKFYADVINYYISPRYEEFLKNEIETKPLLLKALSLDYK